MAITDLLDKSKFVSKEEYHRRLKLCDSCPDRVKKDGSYKKLNKISTCPECGCFCYLKTKLSTEQCPMGDW